VIGRHDGIGRFTVGQRKGLGVAGGEPLYVVRLEPEAARVVVGPRAALGQSRVALAGVNWLGAEAPAAGVETTVTVKLRSAQPPHGARLRFGEAGRAEVLLDDPAEAVAPGQACVFYRGTRVLGGGWIERPARTG